MLAGSDSTGIDPEKLEAYAKEVATISKLGVQVAIVIGGGNIFRGMQGVAKGFDRVDGDAMGMLATVINSIALRSAIEMEGVPASLFTAQPISFVGRHFQSKRGKSLADKWRGNAPRRRYRQPFFHHR